MNERLLILCGVGSVIFGLLMPVIPRAGVLAVVLWSGTYAVAFGMFYVALAVRLQRWDAQETDMRAA